jgi:hypothetical protein
MAAGRSEPTSSTIPRSSRPGNWAGPIGTSKPVVVFVVDRGEPATQVSFRSSNVQKAAPATLEMVAKDYVPGLDIGVLFLESGITAEAAPRADGGRALGLTGPCRCGHRRLRRPAAPWRDRPRSAPET